MFHLQIQNITNEEIKELLNSSLDHSSNLLENHVHMCENIVNDNVNNCISETRQHISLPQYTAEDLRKFSTPQLKQLCLKVNVPTAHLTKETLILHILNPEKYQKNANGAKHKLMHEIAPTKNIDFSSVPEINLSSDELLSLSSDRLKELCNLLNCSSNHLTKSDMVLRIKEPYKYQKGSSRTQLLPFLDTDSTASPQILTYAQELRKLTIDQLRDMGKKINVPTADYNKSELIKRLLEPSKYQKTSKKANVEKDCARKITADANHSKELKN